MQSSTKKELKITACRIRQGAIEAVFSAKSGHPGGSLSAAEIFTHLYFKELDIDPANPQKENRDRFVLSKGHCTPGLYAALALRGFFPVADLKTFRAASSHLQGHPSMKNTPGVDMSTGSLGQGVSAACGMAVGSRLAGRQNRVYALLGDGELQEGQVWEAAMFAAHHKLDNLCLIIDNNNLQIDGTVDTVCSPYPIDEKFAAFGFHVLHADGHCFDSIGEAFAKAREYKGRPSVIIAKTVKGKGVSFMENKAEWHGSAPNAQQYETAMTELGSALRELEGK